MKTAICSLGIAVAALGALPAGAAYKCVDDKGLTRIGDTPPEQCANVVMYEVTSRGSVIRRIEPSLTPAQVQARAEDAERRKEADKVVNEQKRKDLALLATFSSEGEFDTVRDRNIDPIKSRIKLSNDRLAAIDKRVAELNEEMEFYKAGKSKARGKDGKEKAAPEAPPMLVGELQRLKHERDGITRNLVGYDRDIAALKARFDGDKKRWVALKSGTAYSAPEAIPAPDAKSAANKADAKAVPAKPDAKSTK